MKKDFFLERKNIKNNMKHLFFFSKNHMTYLFKLYNLFDELLLFQHKSSILHHVQKNYPFKCAIIFNEYCLFTMCDVHQNSRKP